MFAIEKNKKNTVLSLSLFAVGLLVGLAFYAVVMWGHIEAAQFERPVGGDDALSSLSCPTLITTSETSYASAWLENPTERPMRRVARTRVSEGSVVLAREIETRIELQPGESHEMVWPITAQDAAWGRMVLLRSNVLRNNPLASQTGACGVVVVNVPFFTGRQISAGLMATMVLGLTLGTGMWWTMHQPLLGVARNTGQIMLAFTLLILGGTFVALQGQWMLGAVIYAIILLFCVTITARYLTSENKSHAHEANTGYGY